MPYLEKGFLVDEFEVEEEPIPEQKFQIKKELEHDIDEFQDQDQTVSVGKEDNMQTNSVPEEKCQMKKELESDQTVSNKNTKKRAKSKKKEPFSGKSKGLELLLEDNAKPSTKKTKPKRKKDTRSRRVSNFYKICEDCSRPFNIEFNYMNHRMRKESICAFYLYNN